MEKYNRLRSEIKNKSVYYDKYGEGIIVSEVYNRDGNDYFDVAFGNNPIKTFEFPKAFEMGNISILGEDGELKKVSLEYEEQIELDNIIKIIDDSIKNYNSDIERNKKTIGDAQYNGEDANIDLTWANYQIRNNSDEVDKLRKCENKPYIYHIIFNEDGAAEEEIFFGEDRIKVYNENTKYIVHDWREELGKAFRYAQLNNLSEFDFTGNDNIKHKYKVFLDRHVGIEDKKVIFVESRIGDEGVTTSISVSGYVDENLIRLLKARRNKPVESSLIETISKKQFDIVIDTKKEDIIVEGCAGSGKTAIMLHRLSNYLYAKNVKDNNVINNMKIITPSVYMKNLYNDLSVELKLNEVEYCTIEAYYISLLKKYKANIEINNTIVDEKKQDDEMIEYIYQFGSEDLVEIINKEISFKNLYFKRIDLNAEHSVFNAHIEIKELINRELYGNAVHGRVESNLALDSIKQFVINEYIATSKDSITNSRYLHRIKVYLEDIIRKKNEIEVKKDSKLLQKSNIKNNIAIIHEFEEKILEDYIKNELKKEYNLNISFQEQEVRKDEKIDEINIKLKNVLKNYCIETLIENKEFLLNDIIKNKEIAECLSKLKVVEEFNVERINKIFNEATPKNTVYESDKKYFQNLFLLYLLTDFEYITKCIIEDYCKKVYSDYNIIYDNHIYRFKLYLYLSIAYKYYGMKEGDNYLSIDEAQEFSPNELKLLKKVLGNKCRFDIYGDLNQTLQEYRSLESWNEVDFVNKSNIYTLDYNYRNSAQIVEFVNDMISDLDVETVGLDDGKVYKYSNLEDAVEEFYNFSLSYNDQDDKSKITYAIILPIEIDIDEFKDLIKSILRVEIDDYFSFEKVDFDKISVIDVFTAKGLEFTNALVINAEMNRNQLYVSLTRAIKNLFYCNTKGNVSSINDDDSNQLDKIIKIMKEYEKPIQYKVLYEKYEELTGKVCTYGVKAGIRKNIESHSSDSMAFNQEYDDIFFKADKGTWALRSQYTL